MLNSFSNVHFNGIAGDKDGYFKYNKVETKVAEKWRIILEGSKIRKKFAKNFISNLSPETLEVFGCNQKDLRNRIDTIREYKSKYLVDLIDIFAASIFRYFELPMFVKKIKTRKKSSIPLVCHR